MDISNLDNLKKNIAIICIRRQNNYSVFNGLLIHNNLILTSSHCVTPIENGVRVQIAPDNNSINCIVNGENKIVKDIFRFQNYENDSCIKKLTNCRGIEELELKILRKKIKNYLEFALLEIEKVTNFDNNFIKFFTGNQNSSNYVIMRKTETNFEEIKLINFKVQDNELLSYNSHKIELSGCPIFICNQGNYYLYGMHTSSITSSVDTNGIKLKNFFEEINIISNKSFMNEYMNKINYLQKIEVFSNNHMYLYNAAKPYFSYYMPNLKTLIIEENHNIPLIDLDYFLNLKNLIVMNIKYISEFFEKICLLIELATLKLINISNINLDLIFSKYNNKELKSLTLTQLNLKNDYISKIFQYNIYENLIELDLSYNRISYSVDLLLLLDKVKNLKKLDLSNNLLNGKGLNNLSIIFRSFSRLNHLNLSFNDLKDEENYDEFNSNLSFLKKLEQLYLINKHFNCDKIFFKSLKSLKKLETLDLSNNIKISRESSFPHLSDFLKNSSNVKTLLLNSNGLQNKDLDELKKNNSLKNLEKLSLKNNLINDEGLSFLESFYDVKLKYLDLSFNQFRDDRILQLINKVSILKNLEIFKMEFIHEVSNERILDLLEKISSLKEIKIINIYQSKPVSNVIEIGKFGKVLRKIETLKKIKINCSKEIESFLPSNCLLMNK